MIKQIQNNLIVELHVPDFVPIKDFYGKIGFVVVKEDPVTEKYLGYLVLRRDDVYGPTLLNFYGNDSRVSEQSFFKKFPINTVRGYGSEITIPVADIDTLWAQAKKHLSNHNIARELKEINDEQVRWRDFRLVDPFGFYIRVTELIDWGQ